MSREHRDGVSEGDRAVLEVFAVALLVGVVMLGVATIALVAGPQLDGSQETAEVRQAERSLTQFDAAAARVATGGASSQAVDLGLSGHGGTLAVEPDRGSVTVEYVHSFRDGDRTELMNTSLGTVRYQNDGTTVAYQGGGVWRSDGSGSTMVSPPEISFTGATLSMHVVESERGGSVHSDVELSRAAQSRQRFPDALAGLENRVDTGLLVVTVQSRYYEAWGRYFEDETGTVVQYDHQNEQVTVLFVANSADFSPDAGVVATSGPGQIRLEGSGSYIDSYNSSNGTYAETNGTEGSVKSAGEIAMYGGSQIDGDAEADDDVRIESGNARIDGNASAGDDVIEHDADSVTGTVRTNTSGVPPVPPIDELVEKRVSELASENDNHRTSVIDDGELDVTGSNELQSGAYYLKHLELEDETLVLNTTDGDITIAVETWVKLHGNGDSGQIRVEGNGTVRLFVGSEERTSVNPPSEGKTDLHFYVERNGSVRTVATPRQRSTQFLVFGPSEFEGAIAGSNSDSPRVTAVVVAPAGIHGEGNFQLKHGELYGAVMTGNLTLGKPSAVHFDKAITGEQIPLASTAPRLEYLYLTEHHVAVEPS